MILGLTSGLTSVAYCVLHFEPGHYRPLDSSVLPGTREDVSAFRRTRAHRLTISTLIDRDPPAVIALGPPVTKREPDDFVEQLRALMKSFGELFRVPVICYDQTKLMTRRLRTPDSGALRLAGLVQYHMGRPFPNRRIMLATGAALAAGFQLTAPPASPTTKKASCSTSPPPPL